MSISPTTGVIAWTPTSAQAGSTNTVLVKVTDSGTPTLSATNTFKVVVNRLAGKDIAELDETSTTDGKIKLLSIGTQKGSFHATLNAPAGLKYALQGSHDLINWFDIMTTNSMDDSIVIEDPIKSSTNTFYRVLQVR
jgi:hypothetical protein